MIRPSSPPIVQNDANNLPLVKSLTPPGCKPIDTVERGNGCQLSTQRRNWRDWRRGDRRISLVRPDGSILETFPGKVTRCCLGDIWIRDNHREITMQFHISTLVNTATKVEVDCYPGGITRCDLRP